MMQPSAVYDTVVSEAAEDAAWDSFLAQTPGGHHVQTSLWGQVKAASGMRPVRLLVSNESGIVAGAQLLLRRIPLSRTIAFISKGPVLYRPDPELIAVVLAQLQRVVKEYGIAHLTVQPPNNGEFLVGPLLEHGYVLSEMDVAPTATVELDLDSDLDSIRAQMKKNHRRYIRHGLRQGVTGRRGSAEDLDTFQRLLSATAERQGFDPYHRSYFESIWRLFHPPGHAQLFLTEYHGEPVSAQLVIAFGDRVITKNSGWSGLHGSLGPNHVLEWVTIEWAKANQYQLYDLEGINAAAARLLVAGESLPDEMTRSAFFYKLGFGGEVKLFPRAYAFVANKTLRNLYTTVYPRVRGWPVTDKLLGKVRRGRSGA